LAADGKRAQSNNDTGIVDCALDRSDCALGIANGLLQSIDSEGMLVDREEFHSGTESCSLRGTPDVNVRNRSIGANIHAN
jgi:hypothetical protein